MSYSLSTHQITIYVYIIFNRKIMLYETSWKFLHVKKMLKNTLKKSVRPIGSRFTQNLKITVNDITINTDHL